MSAQEIIDELPKLKPREWQIVREKLDALQSAQPVPKTGWGRMLLAVAGTGEDLPDDLSIHHDHYLYGTPKRP